MRSCARAGRCRCARLRRAQPRDVGLLPPSLREAYGLGWGPQRERLLGAQTTLVRRLMPLLPSLVREREAA